MATVFIVDDDASVRDAPIVQVVRLQLDRALRLPVVHPVDAHAIQPLYTGILGRDCGLTVAAAATGEAVVVTAH